MKTNSAFYSLLFMLFLSSCTVVSSDMEEEEQETIPTLTVTASVDKYHMLKTCEGDGSVGEGDLYGKLFILASTNVGTEPTEIARTDEIVHSLPLNEILTETGIQASVDITPFDGMKLSFSTYIREVDPSATQITENYRLTMVYDESDGCWLPTVGVGCVDGSVSGTSTFNKTYQERMIDTNCDVLIDWSVDIKTN